MAPYVQFKLEDGTIVYVETIDSPRSAGGLLPSSRGGNAEQTSVSFEQSFLSIRKMAAAMLKDLQDGFTQEPEEVSISFNLKASAEVGNLIVARGGMESNYNVTLRWRSKKEEEQKDEKKETGAN